MESMRNGWALLTVCLIATGCSREGAYRTVARDQAAAFQEMADILKTVQDEPAMEEARTSLKRRQAGFADISARAKSLGQPSPEMLEQLSEEYGKLKLALTRLQAEIRRVRALPGGAAFLENLEIGPTTR